MRTEKISKLFNVVITILIFLLIINVIANFQTTFLGKKYNNIFGYTLFEVKTGSMEDTLKIGDWVLVKITDDIKLNDIVTYEEDNAFITHRVIEHYKDTYITKGDANNSKDSPVLRSQIVGKVVKVFPQFGIIKKTLLNPIVLILFIITITLGISLLKKQPQKKKCENKTKSEEEPKLPKETSDFIQKTFTKVPGNSSKTMILSRVTVQKEKKALNLLKDNLENELETLDIKEEKQDEQDEII